MKFVVFLVLLADASFSALQRRIYNGRDANENEFPYLVSIRAAGTTCGGALLDGGFVLTAGHCLMHLDEGQQIFVSLGSRKFYTYAEEPQRVIHKGDMKFWIHENFSMPSAESDLALIRLPVHNVSKSIRPIKISNDNKIDERGEEVIALAAGWGEMETGEPSDTLQTTKMKLIPISECLKYQEHYTENITENHICAFGLHNQPNRVSGPCDGDSGEVDSTVDDQSE